jgi:DNA-binding CsgD family transcriptional regulator
VVSADDAPSPPFPVEHRLDYMAKLYPLDPLRTALIEARSPVGLEVTGADAEAFTAILRQYGWDGPLLYPIYVPLVDDVGVIGAMRFSLTEDASPTLRTELARFAGHVSIRLAKLGICAAEAESRIASLTTRQLQVARLAMADRTNREIADELGLSIDTVKKHLKDVFERLGIVARTELHAHFRRLTPVTEFPPGITVRDGLYLTRVDLHDRTLRSVDE